MIPINYTPDSYEEYLEIPTFMRQDALCDTCGKEADCYIDGQCESCRNKMLKDNQGMECDEYDDYQDMCDDAESDRYESSYLSSFAD